jgi:LAO/AO transport system kinase
LLTGIENGAAAALDEVRALYARSGAARTVGITGAPGTGKSTLITALVKALRAQGKTVAVVAIDPSSPFTNGALLGDRYRMNDLSGDHGVFVRSMASRGALGGTAAAVVDVVTAFDASGFDMVLVETVGAGQNEIDVAWVVESVIVVEAPGLGDDVQAIKAGILEIADIVVVNKADRDGVEQTEAAIQAALDAGPQKAWRVPIHKTTATTGAGVDGVLAALSQHKTYLDSTSKGQWRWEHRVQHDVMGRLRDMLLQRALSNIPADQMQAVFAMVARRQLHPLDAARQLMRENKRND